MSYEDEGVAFNRMLLNVSSQIMLICASLLIFFVHLKLPLLHASGAAIVVMLAGSFFCWQSVLAAKIIFLLSLVGIEATLISFEPWVLEPAALLTIIVAVLLFVPVHWWE